MRGCGDLISVLRHDDGRRGGNYPRCRMLGGCSQFGQCKLLVTMIEMIYKDVNFVAAAVPDVWYVQNVGKGGVEWAGFDSETRVWSCLGHSQASCYPKVSDDAPIQEAQSFLQPSSLV